MSLQDNAITLYHHPKSGHCHKVSLFLSLLQKDVTTIEPDLMAGEHKQPAFLNLNVLGKIPVLTDGDDVIADSNAILVYLAAKYADRDYWLGQSPYEQACIQRWLSVAAGELAYGPAKARLQFVFGATIDEASVLATTTQLLTAMEQHLHKAPADFLVGAHVTLADISLYSYVAHAPEGGISLEPYPQVRQWLNAVETLEHFVPMPASPVPAPRV